MSTERDAADRVLRHLAPEVEAGLCVFEAFRQLGFPADRIFAIYGRNVAAIMVRYGAGEEFTVTLGETQLSAVEFEERWTSAANAWKAGSDAMLTSLWERSWVRGHLLELLDALKKKGVPYVMPGTN